MQDPCGRLPAPDSYAGSTAPSIAGFGGHPTRFSRLQGVARDRDDSYVCQGDRMTFRWPPFWGCGWYSDRSIAGLRTRQGWAAPGGARRLLLGHAQQVRWDRGRPTNRSKASRVRGSRISGQAAPGAWALAGGRAEVAVDLAGDVTLQAADDLRLGFPFRGAALGVGAGGRVRAQPGEHVSATGHDWPFGYRRD